MGSFPICTSSGEEYNANVSLLDFHAPIHAIAVFAYSDPAEPNPTLLDIAEMTLARSANVNA